MLDHEAFVDIFEGDFSDLRIARMKPTSDGKGPENLLSFRNTPPIQFSMKVYVETSKSIRPMTPYLLLETHLERPKEGLFGLELSHPSHFWID